MRANTNSKMFFNFAPNYENIKQFLFRVSVLLLALFLPASPLFKYVLFSVMLSFRPLALARIFFSHLLLRSFFLSNTLFFSFIIKPLSSFVLLLLLLVTYKHTSHHHFAMFNSFSYPSICMQKCSPSSIHLLK